jgi:pSer/pThr/pTyr-binding forkhead associated (FHA) protein
MALQDRRVAAPPPVKSRYCLAGKDTVYPLKVGLNTIGRMPDNDVPILDGSVSRRHCAIVVHAGDGCEVHDTASKNGTFLNGERVTTPTPIKPGDEVRLCDHRLVFLSDDDPCPDPDGGKTFVE